jgi:hypothetical protein
MTRILPAAALASGNAQEPPRWTMKQENTMSRHRVAKSYGHTIRRLVSGDYRLHWTIDRYYAGSRLRHPTGYNRDTDRAGAERFAKKHNVKMPEEAGR